MAKKFAMILGWVLVIAGVLGFFGNPVMGSGPAAMFMMGMAGSIVHLIAGAILLWVAYGAADKSVMALRILGVIYVLVALVGFFGDGSILGLFAVGGWSNWLHLVLGLLMLWGGMKKSGAPMQQAPMGPQM